MTSRCSVSMILVGEWSVSVSGRPLKSVTVTNRSSGRPGGINGAPAGIAAMLVSASYNKPVKPTPENGGRNQRERMKRDSLARTSTRAVGSAMSMAPAPPAGSAMP